MGRYFVWVLGFWLFFGGICSSSAQVRIKDIADFEGVRDNPLVQRAYLGEGHP